MQVSDLQRYILKQTYIRGPRTSRAAFSAFYQKPSDDEVKAITRSIERLIARGLVIGYGRMTAEKMYIETVSITARGRNYVKRMLQLRLPFQKK
ncbi:MAG: hypothetical protein A3B30_01300 [Candidatus Komeilibacteria bacterium RIFCSPLOWO2_01_FULL_52_15]|uniref:Uncharacterized protein n=1 Tax=Candidatus Komeilibacteria bacterium RIFCSPLOWO2_01_FULL_52_15 TaxID=1798551 RepID=A0A1G2BR25_9BACT|nr:MAG: hypothetical protein A3B30_01300 [Candidatus Komeilibacteria bacterium RIFCSPLOWO2_01_FULL_52_15]